MEPLDMTIPAKFAEHIKVFEKLIAPTVAVRDSMWAKHKGDFKSEADQKKFDELNERVEIIQELIRLGRATISIAGVTGGFGEDFLNKMRTEPPATATLLLLTEKAQKLFGYIK